MKTSLKSLLAAAMIFGSQNAGAKSAAVTTTPAVNVVTPDAANRVDLKMDLNVPANYLKNRSRLMLTPALIVGDSIVAEYDPVVLDSPIFSKKVNRLRVLEHYVDPYASVARRVNKTSAPFGIAYNETIQLPEGVDRGRMVALVSTEGCGSCSALDTIDLASITCPNGLVDLSRMQPAMVHPEFKIRPKVHSGKGEARLQFIVNKWDIVMDLANNRAELTAMVDSLRPILADSLAQLTSLNIFGSASAEGSTHHNIMLAENRANSAKQWLASQLEMPAKARNIIKIGARPEGWEPVVRAMYEAGDPDSSRVRELMIKYPGPTDDAAEAYIRRLACWPRIKERYLAKDRKVLYDFTWTVKSFTNDAEMIEMYGKRPDAFNEEEFLHVADLAANDSSRVQVYETLLTYFPESVPARNNLSALYIGRGHPEKAIDLLEGRPNLTPEAQNNLALAYAQTGNSARAAEIFRTLDSPQARYNLGLLCIADRRGAEAMELMGDAADVNAAIAALSVNDNARAASVMAQANDQTPLAEYVRAIIAARAGNEADFKTHIQRAMADETLRSRALTEPEFARFGSILK